MGPFFKDYFLLCGPGWLGIHYLGMGKPRICDDSLASASDVLRFRFALTGLASLVPFSQASLPPRSLSLPPHPISSASLCMTTAFHGLHCSDHISPQSAHSAPPVSAECGTGVI